MYFNKILATQLLGRAIFNCDAVIREIDMVCLLHFEIESYDVINLLLELPLVQKTVVLNYTYHRFERSTTIGMSQGKFDMKGLQSDSSHFHFLLLKHWVSNSFIFFDSLGCYLLAFKSTQWHAVGP